MRYIIQRIDQVFEQFEDRSYVIIKNSISYFAYVQTACEQSKVHQTNYH